MIGLVISLLNPAFSEPPKQTAAEVLTGSWAQLYQEQYEKEMPIRSLSRTVWAAARYIVFREGLDGVLIGRDDWLFTTEEFSYPDQADEKFAASISYIRNVDTTLTEIGSSLVVLIVPSKARVYNEMLGRYGVPAPLEDRYHLLRGHITGLGIPAPDTLAALHSSKEKGMLFCRTDTHWTPLGAEVVAEIVSETVGPLLAGHSGSEGQYVQREEEEISYFGDLMNYIPLGPLTGKIGPKPDSIVQKKTVNLDESTGDLFGALQVPVILVGTSYSAGELWNLTGALQYTLQTDVLTTAEEGEGPFVPMQAFLDSLLTGGNIHPEVVIWEIPERYVTAFDLAEPTW
jgi:alginate O-acetyltransferase complex protein AlgJ